MVVGDIKAIAGIPDDSKVDPEARAVAMDIWNAVMLYGETAAKYRERCNAGIAAFSK